VEEICATQPRPPAIRILDAGAGDGTALARILRGLHRRHPWVPFYVVAKEISLENVRLTLEKLPDRLREHPASVIVITNLKYSECARLQPENPTDAGRMVWKEVALDGTSAGQFEEQINDLEPFLAEHWQTRIGPSSGNPLYKTPCALVLYRSDHGFMLDPMIPRRGYARTDLDFVLLSQPYRAGASLEFKTRNIVKPLVEALRPMGKLMVVQSAGGDPAMEIVRKIWPDEDPFQHDRGKIMASVASELGPAAVNYEFHDLPADRSTFRFKFRMLPSEISQTVPIGTSTLCGAWNAASYVMQIEDTRLAAALASDAYLSATSEVLQERGGLWFNDEVFIISRRGELG